MAIFSLVAGIGFSSMHSWAAAERQRGTASAIESLLRTTQQRAITESRPMCVSFDLTAQNYSMSRGVCGTPDEQRLQGPMRPDGGVTLDSASFAAGGGATAPHVTFYPRGTATPGTVRIMRADSDRVDVLAVDGLTGRVSRG